MVTKEEANKKHTLPTELWLDQSGDGVVLMYKLSDGVPRSLLYIDGDENTANLFSNDCINLGLRKV